MARGSSTLRVIPPKHLSNYLAQGEVLYVETRSTKLFYFPGPVLALIILLAIDYSAAAAKYGWSPFPGLTALFKMLSSAALQYALFGLGLVTLLVLLWLLVRWVLWIRTVYAVSNHRILIKRGIASRDIDDIPMNQVRGVDVHQTVGQRLLRYGTVKVSAEFGTDRSIGNEDWKGIPNPFQVQRTIETVMQNLQNPVMPAIAYPQQPTMVYAGPPPYQPPPASPPK